MSRVQSVTERTNIDTIQAQRNPEEEGDYMAFEQLVAEAAAKKESKKKGKDKDKKPASADPVAEAAADAPNVPRA